MWEADDGADLDGRAGEFFFGEWDQVWLYASCGDVIVAGDFEALDNVGVGHGWVEEGVVDHLGELGEGYFYGVGRHCGGWCRIYRGVINMVY